MRPSQSFCTCANHGSQGSRPSSRWAAGRRKRRAGAAGGHAAHNCDLLDLLAHHLLLLNPHHLLLLKINPDKPIIPAVFWGKQFVAKAWEKSKDAEGALIQKMTVEGMKSQRRVSGSHSTASCQRNLGTERSEGRTGLDKV